MARRKLTDEEIKAAADRAEGKPGDEAPSTPKVGRPTQYRETYPEQARKLCELGATDVEVADFFGVDEFTIYRWKIKYPDFCGAMLTGKENLDERVQRSLYHRAVGYTFSSEKIFQHSGEIIRAKTREHVPPDTAACSLWLRNRRPAEWRDKVFGEVSLTGEVKFIVEGAPPMKTINPPTIESVASDG
jgi:hypothetical protein